MIAEDKAGNILVQGDYVDYRNVTGQVFHVGTDSDTLSERSVVVRIDAGRLTVKASLLKRIEVL